MDHITANAETLVRQASATADEYLRDAIRCIDARLGEGYAQKNPVLVGAFMGAAAQDYASAIGAAVRQDGDMCLNAIADSLDRLAGAVAALDIG